MFIETHLGRVSPLECDQLGHMNVQFYVAKVSDAAWHVMASIGITPCRHQQQRVVVTQPVRVTQRHLAIFAAAMLLLNRLVDSRFGRVLAAIRDAESRVMFIGYNPLWYKLTIWTISAVLCGIAGALYVPQVGIINPSEMTPAASIEMAIWAAVGGRGTLIGPIVGAFFVNGAKSWFTVAFPEFWLYFLGALFIAVTLFLPQGIVGLFDKFSSKKKETRA